MTNHSETTGSFENGDITGREGCTGPESCDGEAAYVHGGARGNEATYDHAATYDRETTYDGEATHDREAVYDRETAYEGHVPYDGRPGCDEGPEHQVTLRSPAELADALPYLLGYRPEDSIVLVALHDQGGRGRFGGRARLGIPANPDDWPAVARQLAQGLVTGSERRGGRPAQIVAYLCQDPALGETGAQVRQRLQPLAHRLRVECGRLDIPVIEALCISDGRFWSYCCPAEGAPMGLPGTSVLAAAATYAGIQVRGTLRELRARLLPLETGVAVEQESALDTAGMALVPKMLHEVSRSAVADETIALAARLIRRFSEAPKVTGGTLVADRRDDELLAAEEAADLVLGLQDRVTRDRAAEWMEGDEAAPALRLWRALARRCVGPYGEHAAAPLTLAGWVAWSSGDELEAREALAMALGADPGYLFARLLHQACNQGLDPESVRRCLRSEREVRGDDEARQGTDRPAEAGASASAGAEDQEVGVDGTGDRGEAQRAEASDEDGGATGCASGSALIPSPAAGRRRRRMRSVGSTRPTTPGQGGTRSRTRTSDVASAQRRSGGADGDEINRQK
ncbi:DUF4192 domain-containing protein [Streptomyces bobili]|uniref:DUF4192 domain-containing protein n=1 Tax=Streptomyces bobili TaxID=67280 RepID=UPI002254AA4D|nr:DUF4192 domain-containing protein [Streptomyces bobili]MCX5527000.1 DUF4192 domain-containing protein [Streptomyces bobili]